jgi:hypothetical protein
MAAQARRAEFPLYTLEERACAFIAGWCAGRCTTPEDNPFPTGQQMLRRAWRSGWKIGYRCNYGMLSKKSCPTLIVTWSEAMKWATAHPKVETASTGKANDKRKTLEEQNLPLPPRLPSAERRRDR